MVAGSDPGAPHWKRCGAVAKIIAGCPVPKQQIHHYVISVSQQVCLHLYWGGGGGGYYDSGLSVAGNKVSSVSQQLC